MAIILQAHLFSWENVKAESDLKRLSYVLGALPDEKLMQRLEARRGRGRDDYAVRPTWNSLLAGVLFEHKTIESLRRELCRNGELRQACGFDPARGHAAVPTARAYTNLLQSLMECYDEVEAMFDRLVDRLAKLLPDFGARLAVDSKAIASFAKKKNKKRSPDGRRDLDADWGKKEYRGTNEDGTAWSKTVKWFGYKLHLIVDSTYELPVGFEVTPASASDQKHLLPLLAKLKQNHPELVERTEYTSADRGYDSKEHNRKLYDTYGAKPIIGIRHMWKDGETTRPLYTDRADSIVYDEDGTIFCVCPTSGQRREMAYCGFEADRGTLKYRCPAAAYGLQCAGRSICAPRKSDYGRVVRVPIELDRRLFVPLPRSSYAWQREYDKRTAVERVNSRLDVSFGFELHTIRGKKKMHLRAGLALVVMLSLAVGAIEAGHKKQMRSLVKCYPTRAAA